jgi:two-component system, LytTR family, response regulator
MLTEKLKALIIDDEEPARNLIKNFLSDYPNIELTGEFPDGLSGLKAINELKPDLIFLDIQMPKLTGFEMLELMELRPHIIFTTAYDQFAIKAFDEHATDYLLKPFSKERFAKAINRVIENPENLNNNEKHIRSILKTVNEKKEFIIRIAVKSGSKIDVIGVDDISYLEAEGDYVMIYTKNDCFLKEKTMKYFEDHLDNSQFVRIHRSFIVNVNEISRLEHYDKENYLAVLKNQKKLKVSSAGHKLLKQLLHL